MHANTHAHAMQAVVYHPGLHFVVQESGPNGTLFSRH